MSKATIVKGHRVVATADSLKEAKAYAKKIGGKVLVPAGSARKNGGEKKSAKGLFGRTGETHHAAVLAWEKVRESEHRRGEGNASPASLKKYEIAAEAARKAAEDWERAQKEHPDRYGRHAAPDPENRAEAKRLLAIAEGLRHTHDFFSPERSEAYDKYHAFLQSLDGDEQDRLFLYGSDYWRDPPPPPSRRHK